MEHADAGERCAFEFGQQIAQDELGYPLGARTCSWIGSSATDVTRPGPATGDSRRLAATHGSNAPAADARSRHHPRDAEAWRTELARHGVDALRAPRPRSARSLPVRARGGRRAALIERSCGPRRARPTAASTSSRRTRRRSAAVARRGLGQLRADARGAACAAPRGLGGRGRAPATTAALRRARRRRPGTWSYRSRRPRAGCTNSVSGDPRAVLLARRDLHRPARDGRARRALLGDELPRHDRDDRPHRARALAVGAPGRGDARVVPLGDLLDRDDEPAAHHHHDARRGGALRHGAAERRRARDSADDAHRRRARRGDRPGRPRAHPRGDRALVRLRRAERARDLGDRGLPARAPARLGELGVIADLLRDATTATVPTARPRPSRPRPTAPCSSARSRGPPAARAPTRVRGADARRQRKCGPLSQAALGGHVDVARLLLGQGARLDAADAQHGHTPLHLAAMSDQVDVVHALLAAGAARAPASARARTPLHEACAAGAARAARALLAHDAGAAALHDAYFLTPRSTRSRGRRGRPHARDVGRRARRRRRRARRPSARRCSSRGRPAETPASALAVACIAGDAERARGVCRRKRGGRARARQRRGRADAVTGGRSASFTPLGNVVQGAHDAQTTKPPATAATTTRPRASRSSRCCSPRRRRRGRRAASDTRPAAPAAVTPLQLAAHHGHAARARSSTAARASTPRPAG